VLKALKSDVFPYELVTIATPNFGRSIFEWFREVARLELTKFHNVIVRVLSSHGLQIAEGGETGPQFDRKNRSLPEALPRPDRGQDC